MATESETELTADAIRFTGVHKLFRTAEQATLALRHLTFAVARGEYVCVLGRSGCGKSTTVNLLLGLGVPTSGQVSVLGHDPHREFARLRGRIACVFQNDRLLPWRNAIDNVRLPMEILGLDTSSAEAETWLQRLGLQGFEYAMPHQLSGGMRQRVALARALTSDPDILLADEAFGHLDEVTGNSLRTQFRQLAKDRGKTVLHITHSIDEALDFSDRILVLGKPGSVVADIAKIRELDVSSRVRLRAEILQHLQGPGVAAAAAGEAGVPPHLWEAGS
ncbi:MAG: ATP-binding cassette protein [Rhodospirillales bacterium]|nr:ATP-binding cassette protein [Rhodospirillales bacterium]